MKAQELIDETPSTTISDWVMDKFYPTLKNENTPKKNYSGLFNSIHTK